MLRDSQTNLASRSKKIRHARNRKNSGPRARCSSALALEQDLDIREKPELRPLIPHLVQYFGVDSSQPEAHDIRTCAQRNDLRVCTGMRRQSRLEVRDDRRACDLNVRARGTDSVEYELRLGCTIRCEAVAPSGRMHEAVVMSERGYRGSRLVRSAKDFIRDEGCPEQVCAARVIQQSLTLSLVDARALSFQHGGEFVACDVHSRALAG